MEVNGHTVVRRVVVHISHNGDLDSRIFLHHPEGVVVDDFSPSAAKVTTLASDSGRKMGNIECKMFSVNRSVNHQYVTGTEFFLLIPVHRELDCTAFEGERNRLAVDIGKLLGLVEQGHIDSTAVRTVIVDNLVVRLRNLRLAHKILQHKTVLDFANSENGVETTVGIGHRPDDGSHIVEFLCVLGLGPLVLSFRQELLVVLRRVIVGVKKVLKVVETYDIIPFSSVCGRLG